MYEEFTYKTLKVGDKCYRKFFTDCAPCTVVEVRRNGREIVVQEDRAEAARKGLGIGHQEWKIFRNPEGPKSTFTWRTRKGREIGYVSKGAPPSTPYRSSIGPGWHYYYDWSF